VLDLVERPPELQAAAPARRSPSAARVTPLLIAVGVLSPLSERRKRILSSAWSTMRTSPTARRPTPDLRRTPARADGSRCSSPREGEVRTFPAPGIPELRLAGLDGDAAGALLAAQRGMPFYPSCATV
jgi:hypothetical protein